MGEEPANNQKKIGGNNPILLANHFSANKASAILTHQTAKSEENTTVTNLTSKGTVVANPNPPKISPFAKSKKRLANPLAWLSFNDISIHQNLARKNDTVNFKVAVNPPGLPPYQPPGLVGTTDPGSVVPNRSGVCKNAEIVARRTGSLANGC